MVSNRRARELARQKADRQAKFRAERRQKQRRQTIIASGATIVIVLVVIGGIFALNKKDSPATLSAAGTPSASAPAGACSYKAGGTAAKKVELPPVQPVTTDAAVPATVTINGKPVQVSLNAAAAPCTVNSFVSLAQQKYFDATPCHRLTTSASLKVLQCGDPSGTGTQGPGYSFADENLKGATYPAGTVAMANSGANTNGSQFFLVYADSQLGPDYTPFGKITGGLDVLTSIAKAGVSGGGSDGAPKSPVLLTKVAVDLAAGGPSTATPAATASAAVPAASSPAASSPASPSATAG